MFDIGFQELILILVIALLVFGPKRLPELGRALGRALREFRRASEEFRSTLETNLHINEPDPIAATPEPAPAESAPASPAPVTEPLPDSVLNPYGEGNEAPSGEPYWAQRGSRLFHARSCGWAGRIPEPERVYFKRVSEAKEQGFTTCPVCEPREPD
ncbi:MAG: twin-arginine translocase subunit TatB [Candidatus Rokubacteria bacterium]|nr:twin-arginine translocase subunit TatB [Candidatus Rokubacteria bacterium]